MRGFLALIISGGILVLFHMITNLPFTVTPTGIVIKLVAIGVLYAIIRAMLGGKK